MPVKENKSPFCIDCQYVFDKYKKYHSQDRCNPCYQKFYVNKNRIGRPKQLNESCVKCLFKFDTLNEKGKPVLRGSKGMCKRCYHRTSKATKICNECGNEMLNGSRSGICAVCRLNRPTKRKRKEVKIPLVDKEQFELIRRLLVRYKVGHNTMVDNFRVVDIYMDVNDNPIVLDTLSEESQIVEMLRNLKTVFDYNLPLSKKANMGVKMTKQEYARAWYKKNKERIKNEYKKEKEISIQ